MGANASVKIANSTFNDVWVRVEAERSYLVEIETNIRAKIKSVHLSVGRKEKYEHIAQEAGYSRIPSQEFINFDVPHEKYECYVSAFDSDGKLFGNAKCFRATHNTYFNIVLCSDYAMRKGFKNKIYRCAEGSQEYWGPFQCPGCGTQKCKSPVISGSDGWCANVGS